MVTEDQLRIALLKYVPENAVATCVEWIRRYRISVRIKHTRATKNGDDRPPYNGANHTITINHDLNPYAFLITFTHEVAHLTCFLKHSNRVMPHGQEWKEEFRQLLIPFLRDEIFPHTVREALIGYIKNPAASSCSDVTLMKSLKAFDNRSDGWIHVEDIPLNSKFEIKNGQQFIRGELRRKNYNCTDANTGLLYFVPPHMDAKIID